MKCNYCGALDSKVIDSRLNEDGTSIRRRRECVKCSKRYTTYETIETTPIMVVKKSGNRQVFLPEKVKAGIMKACDKRPVPIYKIDKLVDNITKDVTNILEQEVSSDFIGELIMDGLKEIDEVAFVRYAAVHRQFKDINTWFSEIEDMIRGKKPKN